MSALAITAWILGALAIGGGLFSFFKPALVRVGLEHFPRSVWPGRVLLAVDMVWAAVAVTTLHLGSFDALKIHLYWMAPVCIILGALYLDELLSVRSLGGLLLLLAGPILNLTRWHPSAWRLVVTTLSYLWIVAGLVFLLTPWWFRRIAMRISSDAALRFCGAVKAAFGVFLIVLAITVY
jgi:hypothetical protein